MVPKLDLRLLSPPQITILGKPLDNFVTRKTQALFIYLAVEQRTHTRDGLAAFFWRDVSDQYARNSLRRILPNLRALLGDYLQIDRNTIAFDPASPHELDLDIFRNTLTALPNTAPTPPSALNQVEQALQLYQSDFLESFVVRDAPAFEDWVLLQREYLRSLAIQGFSWLAERYLELGKHEAGLAATKRLLAIEPWSETAHQQRMVLLARVGQRTAALAQYETCRAILAEEFATVPSAAMTTLYQQIKVGGYHPQANRLDEPLNKAAPPVHRSAKPTLTPAPVAAPTQPRVDWGEIPRQTTFNGREEELAQLTRWLVEEQCALVAVIGVGGVGKTALTAQLVRSLAQPATLAHSFEQIVWRSLVNAPPLEVVLRMGLQILSDQPLLALPTALDDQLALLFDQLRRQRCLLVLDNVESLLQPGTNAGHFRPGYENYAHFFRRFGEVDHRSCLLLTSRELPAGVVHLEREFLTTRSLRLDGLPEKAGIQILHAAGLYEASAVMTALVQRYSGNPLALKLVAEAMIDHYQGDFTFFLQEETLIFDDLRSVLSEQFQRLTEVERELLIWLTIEREPMTTSEVWTNFVHTPSRRSLLEAQRSLYRRSLIEQHTAFHKKGRDSEVKVSLQNVVLEYVTDTLLETISAELENEMLDYFLRYALVQAQVTDYIRAVQRRLILQPIAQRLYERYGRSGVEAKLKHLLNKVRQNATWASGYAAANLLHLALALDINLNGWDFSQLTIWQVDFRTASLANVNFRGADLRKSIFSENFGIVKAIAISPDSRYLAAGESGGKVFIWRMSDYGLHLLLQGHTQPVSSLAFSPNGDLLASGGFDGLICLWDPTTGELVSKLPAHTNTISGIAYSADGNYVASSGADRRIVVWDWCRNEIRAILPETVSVAGLVFSPDGRRLIVAQDDKQANVWDWRDGTILQSLIGHEDKLLSVACSPDGTIVATGGEDTRICLWQLSSPGVYRVLNEHTGWVWSLAFSPDGERLVSASTDLTIRLWDVATGRLRRTLTGHTGWACAVAYAPDGSMIASGGYDRTVRLWDESTGLTMRTLHGYLPRVDLVTFSTDGGLLASSSLDGPIHLWDVHSGQHLQKLTGHQGAIRSVAFSASNKVVAGGCDDHRVYLWDRESGKLKQTLIGHTDIVRHVTFSLDGCYLVTGSYDRTLRIWEATTGQLCHIIHQAHAKLQSATAFSPDGLVLAYGSYDNTVKLLRVGSGEVVERLPIAQEEPVAVAFSPQGQLLVCVTKSGTLWVWDVNKGQTSNQIELRFRVQAIAQAIWRILFSPSGRHLAVCGDDGAIHILDLASGAISYSLLDENNTFALAFSREGDCLATAGAENTILIRATSTGEVRRTLSGHLTAVTSLSVSPVEDVIASSSVDGIVCLWNMVTGNCMATLEPVGPYAGMNISGATGITATQRAILVALGAIAE